MGHMNKFLTLCSLLPSSGSVCHQRRVLCGRYGATHADADSSGVHAVSHRFLQRVRALPWRRHEEG